MGFRSNRAEKKNNLANRVVKLAFAVRERFHFCAEDDGT